MTVDDLFNRAAEVDVDDRSALVLIQLGGFGHNIGLAPGKLHCHRELFGRILCHQQRLAVLADHSLAGNHLGNHQPRTVLLDETTERHVSYPGHRRKDDGRSKFDRADLDAHFNSDGGVPKTWASYEIRSCISTVSRYAVLRIMNTEKTMQNDQLETLAATLLQELRNRMLRLATAESCTGGLVAASLTAIAGSSDVFERGWVTYSNDAKEEDLGVPMQLIEKHGAVSEQVARAMAEGAVENSRADIAVSVTGVAGPGGGSEAKPVGTVWFGCARRGQPTHTERHQLNGDRPAIRLQSVAIALQLAKQAAISG